MYAAMRARVLSIAILGLLVGASWARADGRARKPRRVAGVKVVNVGGPLDGVERARYGRPDFRHVDLRRGKNTTVADVNTVDLHAVFGDSVRVLRASNVPFSSVPGGWVKPARFVRQAEELGVERIIATTGKLGRKPLKQALRRRGWTVEVRRIPRRGSSEPWYVITGLPPDTRRVGRSGSPRASPRSLRPASRAWMLATVVATPAGESETRLLHQNLKSGPNCSSCISYGTRSP